MSINHKSRPGLESIIAAAETAPLDHAAGVTRQGSGPLAPRVACLWQACADSVTRSQPVWSQLSANYQRGSLLREVGPGRARAALLRFLILEHQRRIRLLRGLLAAESAAEP